jgi:hypothetical protein
VKTEETLPEVILLHGARGGRPENTAGAGEFWYEPEVWSLPLAPKVLYAGLCSFLGKARSTAKTSATPSKTAPTKR